MRFRESAGPTVRPRVRRSAKTNRRPRALRQLCGSFTLSAGRPLPLPAERGGGQVREQEILDTMFEGFQHEVIDVGVTTIAVRSGGEGAPVLLLHGFPETHVMWHRVAPALAEDFTVVCADLRGYGASGTPPSTSD